MRTPRAGAGMALPLALAGGALMATLAWLPLVSVSKLGIERAVRLGGLGAGLREQGMAPLGWFVDFCLLLAPGALLVSIILLSLAIQWRAPFPGWRHLLTVIEWSRRWAMLEVLVLAILVSFLKIGALARATFESGFAVLGGATLALLAAQQAFDVRQAREVLGGSMRQAGGAASGRLNGAGSLQAATALLCAAAVALVPANLLPVMEMSMGPTLSSNTIFSSIVMLAEEGMWGIALVVFVASFLVPLGKLGGLAWLLWQARGVNGTARSVRLHGWIDFIGRWSMLDVLLIGVLVALVQFGALAQVRPGLGAAAFAGAVVLTIFAVEAFPLRRLFHPPMQYAIKSRN